ncbi:MAG: hypothetical protein KY434_00215 [Actinobacteria bacterium]|nr:hypothetical protein [Actinomycetota bacterium]
MTSDGLTAAVATVVFVAGAGVVGGTVLSAVRTIVLPRGTAVLLSRVVFGSLRRLFDARARRARTYERRDDAMALYAPISLLTLPLVWLALVLGGYTLMSWAAESRSWSDAFVTSGSSLLTLGYERPGNLAATALSFSEAALGIAVLALLLVTYLPSMYAAFSRREAQIALLEARAGSPPPALSSTAPPCARRRLRGPGRPRRSCASARATWRCGASPRSSASPMTRTRPPTTRSP